MPPSKPSATSKADSGRWGLLRLILTFAAIAWVVRSLIFAPFSIPSGSMLPTLLIGDYVLVAKWPYGYSRFSFPLQFPPIEGRIPSGLPERGDVVVFRPPGAEGQDFVKRVIGLPGDTIEVRAGVPLLNGQPLRRRQLRPLAMPVSTNSPCRSVPGAVRFGPGGCSYPAYRETLPGGRSFTILDQVADGPADDFPTVRVPGGHLFLMGDKPRRQPGQPFRAGRRRHRLRAAGQCRRPLHHHFLVDRRQRQLFPALDLVHRAPRQPHRHEL